MPARHGSCGCSAGPAFDDEPGARRHCHAIGCSTPRPVLLIVRNELTRLALLALVARDCSTPVLGTAATVMEAQFFPYPTPPHVVIVDVPARDHHPAGLDAIAEVRRSFGQARVLALIE